MLDGWVLLVHTHAHGTMEHGRNHIVEDRDKTQDCHAQR